MRHLVITLCVYISPLGACTRRDALCVTWLWPLYRPIYVTWLSPLGALRPHYGGALLCVSFVGTLAGQVLLQALLRQHKVQSLLLLFIAAVVGGFALVMGGMSFVSFVHAVQIGEMPGLRPICEAEAPDR